MMADRYRYLHTSDVLVCNCAADAALSTKFFPNATVRIVPFAFDETLFYRDDPATHTAMRVSLGLQPHEKVVLYSGRLSLEKNIHTILKAFRVVLEAVPNARLVIAGEEANRPFREFGTYPLETKRMLTRLCARLGIADERVLFVGRRAPGDLRALYGAADVLVNLTLNHDENFGYVQVEAMACGLPVVGSAWGGLKDTIADGVTGVQVPTVVTAAGVKVDWWFAANAIVRLLTSHDLSGIMRQQSCEIARQRYSAARYRQNLEQLLFDCASLAADRGESLEISAFAEQYWATCSQDTDDRPPYRRGAQALRLYEELIAAYASEPTRHNGNGSGSAWLLAAPLRVRHDGRISVDDPLYPLDLHVPRRLGTAIRALCRQLARRPVLPDEALAKSGPSVRAALTWMNEAGLVLRTERGMLATTSVPAAVGRPAFDIREVDHDTDIVWFS
jgi:hypothetical protein